MNKKLGPLVKVHDELIESIAKAEKEVGLSPRDLKIMEVLDKARLDVQGTQIKMVFYQIPYTSDVTAVKEATKLVSEVFDIANFNAVIEQAKAVVTSRGTSQAYVDEIKSKIFHLKEELSSCKLAIRKELELEENDDVKTS